MENINKYISDFKIAFEITKYALNLILVVTVKFILCKEQLPQVDTNCDSSGEGDKNPDFETNEHVNEDTPHELEISYVTSLDEREPNDDLVSSCLEDESIELLEKVRFLSLFLFHGNIEKNAVIYI